MSGVVLFDGDRPITGPDARPCDDCGDHDDLLRPCRGAEGYCEGRGIPPSLDVLHDPRAAFVEAIRRAANVGGCLNPEDGAQALAHVEAAGLRIVVSDGRHPLLPDTPPGMVVDGDVLADCVADAVPRTVTDEAARALAETVLRLVYDAGMTVLRGKGSEPWTPPKRDAS